MAINLKELSKKTIPLSSGHRACAGCGSIITIKLVLMAAEDPIVCVSAAALHRRDAIDAVDFCMDHLKSAAWFWKREKRAKEDGDSRWHWIEPREQDHSDLARWQA